MAKKTNKFKLGNKVFTINYPPPSAPPPLPSPEAQAVVKKLMDDLSDKDRRLACVDFFVEPSPTFIVRGRRTPIPPGAAVRVDIGKMKWPGSPVKNAHLLAALDYEFRREELGRELDFIFTGKGMYEGDDLPRVVERIRSSIYSMTLSKWASS